MARLTRIARRLADGETINDIASTEQINRTWLSELANSPECRQILADFVNSELNELHSLWYQSLHVIRAAMNARKEYCDKTGTILRGGPDHYARLAATKHFRDFLMGGRPPAVLKSDDKNQHQTISYPELEALVQKRSQETRKPRG